MQQHLTLHRDGATWLHRMHPYNKLMYTLLICSSVYCLPMHWTGKPLLLGVHCITAAGCGFLSRLTKASWIILLPLALFLFPIHGIFHPDNSTVLFSTAYVTVYQEGISYACTIILQLAVILTSSLLFVFTTHPTDIINALLRTGWPPSLAYLFGAPLFMLPAMRQRIQTIQAAQRSRGLDSEASIWARIRAIPPLVTPLILSTFSEIEQRAIALELRGFTHSGSRVYIRPVPDSPTQRAFRWVMLLAFILLCAYNVLSPYIL
ncbi:MAG: energy-coupling factor transporter transmembrane protein EcfT [Desulfovibrionales bacterium]|nr:energy-coupling factor transporter transmembrane protein EcfT [Desulfovibrionales bacterium]